MRVGELSHRLEQQKLTHRVGIGAQLDCIWWKVQVDFTCMHRRGHVSPVPTEPRKRREHAWVLPVPRGARGIDA